jgi:hypothetical protein
MLTMVTNTLRANAVPDGFANRTGRLIELRGDVVDALFDPAALPDLLTELTSQRQGARRRRQDPRDARPGDALVRGLTASALPMLPKGATY